MFAMILLQAGRMNICADYVPLHYGLRNEYVLDNGGGIYENLEWSMWCTPIRKALRHCFYRSPGCRPTDFPELPDLDDRRHLIAAGQIVELFVGRRYAVRCMTLLCIRES